MLFQLKSYLSFIFKSKNEHGIHSPFVYGLVTKCFYSNTKSNNFELTNSFLKDLLQNHDFITVKDFGAGSKNLNKNTRKISSIAKKAGISKKRNQLLYKIIKYFNSQHILEIGTSLGIATSTMALANKETKIVTLEGCPETAKMAQKQFEKYNFENIKVSIGEFNKTLPKALKDKIFDLIFFDGNHQKKPTIQYFEQSLNHINNDSVFIFDDIYWSKDMSEAWDYIRNHSKVTVSIDTFQWGIVFFRKEQPKQHFTIRI